MNFRNPRKYPRVLFSLRIYLSNAYIRTYTYSTQSKRASERATQYLLMIVLLKFCYLHIGIVCEFYCCCWSTTSRRQFWAKIGNKQSTWIYLLGLVWKCVWAYVSVLGFIGIHIQIGALKRLLNFPRSQRACVRLNCAEKKKSSIENAFVFLNNNNFHKVESFICIKG